MGAFFQSSQGLADPIIADHTTTHIYDIPQAAIEQAKASLIIAYGHTSHGSQITTGMSGLVGFMNSKGYPTNLYDYNSSGADGDLQLRDTPFPEPMIWEIPIARPGKPQPAIIWMPIRKSMSSSGPGVVR